MKGIEGVMCVGWRKMKEERRVLMLSEILSERSSPHKIDVSVGVHKVWLREVEEEEVFDDGRTDIGDVVSICTVRF